MGTGEKVGSGLLGLLALGAFAAYGSAAMDLSSRGEVDPAALASRTTETPREAKGEAKPAPASSGSGTTTATKAKPDAAPAPAPVAAAPATPTPAAKPELVAKVEPAKPALKAPVAAVPSRADSAHAAPAAPAHDSAAVLALADKPAAESTKASPGHAAPTTDSVGAQAAAVVDAGTPAPRKRHSHSAASSESAESSEPAAGDDWGSLNLKADSPADVYVDGKKVKKSQLAGYKTPPGNHVVRFDCIGSDGTKSTGTNKTVDVVPYAEVDVEWECAAQSKGDGTSE